MAETRDTSGSDTAGHFDYYPLRVDRIVRETADACSVVLEIPESLGDLFNYKAGQYLTLRVEIDGELFERCYSLASSPAVDSVYKITVKAVAEGRVSSWINTRLQEGAIINVMPPHGRFCLRENSADLLFFSGGSGITPCISILKTALATSDRKIRLLYANRDLDSVIFHEELKNLQSKYSGRFDLIDHLDSDSGFVTPHLVQSIADEMGSPDIYICGPGPFIKVVETTLLESGFDRHKIFVEHFLADTEEKAETSVDIEVEREVPESVTLIVNNRAHDVPYRQGDTLLEAAQEQGVRYPFACRIGSCATCLGRLVEGKVHMMVNNVLTDEEVAEGLVLVCQSIPLSKTITVKYEQ